MGAGVGGSGWAPGLRRGWSTGSRPSAALTMLWPWASLQPPEPSSPLLKTPCAHRTVRKPASVPALPLSALLCFLLSSHTGPLVLLDHPRGLPPQALSLPSVRKDLPQGSARPTPPVTQALRPAGRPLVLPLPHWAHHPLASQTKTRLAVEQARHRGGIPGDSTRTRNLEQSVHRGRKLVGGGGPGLGGRQNGQLLFNGCRGSAGDAGQFWRCRW